MHKKTKNIKIPIIVALTILTVIFAVMIIFLPYIQTCIMFQINNLGKNEPQITQEEVKELQNTITFTNNRNDYASDLEFANFRPLKGGNLKDNYIFRGASPYLDNERTIYVNRYLEINNIRHFVSLSEDYASIENYLKNDDYGNLYFGRNYKNNRLFDDALTYQSIDLNNPNDVKKIIDSFNNISNSNEKVYIHCQIGRDRTGIYCTILEALAGFSYEEIVDDYMLSFKNYSYITKEDTPQQYNNLKTIGVDSFLKLITKQDNIEKIRKMNLCDATKNYLESNDMPKEGIEKFINHLIS